MEKKWLFKIIALIELISFIIDPKDDPIIIGHLATLHKEIEQVKKELRESLVSGKW